MEKIKGISDETIGIIRRKSACSLPDNPTDFGYTPDQIRAAFYKPITDDSNSVIGEVNRIVNEVNKVLETNDEKNNTSFTNKLDKSYNPKTLYAVSSSIEQEQIPYSTSPVADNIPMYSANGCLSVNTPTSGDHATPKSYVDSMVPKIVLSMDKGYVMTVGLTDNEGKPLSSATVDLPLESMIIGASYADKTLTLNLNSENSDTIKIDVSDLISGLVSDTVFNEAISEIKNNMFIKEDKESLIQEILAEVPQAEEEDFGCRDT